ncbi:hypothetical protein KGF56_002180 [Candida oxycetoniae]|uniref:DUF1892-domain-containing protein n=1 Tax=Candida oxycetoniae TaxID=497107 RepID=A0AAI9WYN3_9ASCO|nr:uncharacterized protein KGF56_002180 [Candida oxycetoniae]KAI3405015.1 hypothetical protein KGF56_002180 [Candida oxycetoniae]
MSVSEQIPHEDLENPLRIVLVLDIPNSKESEMEERLLDDLQTFDSVNEFFDAFDEKVAIPNEGHIKYEVGSDGLVVIIVDGNELKDRVLEFIDEYEQEMGNSNHDKEEEEEEEEKEEDSSGKKKQKK